MNSSPLPGTSSSLETPAPRRLGPRLKFLVALFAFSLIPTTIFGAILYFIEKRQILEVLNARLDEYAKTLSEKLPPNYLDEAVTEGAVTDSKYADVVERLNRYQVELADKARQESSLSPIYLYFYFYSEADAKFHLTATNGTPEEVKTNSRYWESYPKPKAMAEVWRTGIPYHGRGEDDGWSPAYASFSKGRTLSAKQTPYIVGVDFDENQVEHRARRAIIVPALTGFGTFSLLFLLSYFTSARFFKREEYAARDLQIAADIQLKMVSRDFSVPGRIAVHAALRPARDAGGDFYDVFMLDANHLCVAIADVSDKGVGAALVMSMALTSLRAHATPDLADAPDEILRRTNAFVCRWFLRPDGDGTFVTILLGVVQVQTGRVIYSHGGHLFPILRSADGGAQSLDWPMAERGLPLGFDGETQYRSQTLQLKPLETLLFYSDGVTDARSGADGPSYGMKRVVALLAGFPLENPPAQCTVRVISDVDHFVQGYEQYDDITVLAVQFKR